MQEIAAAQASEGPRWSPPFIQTVREGMREAVNAPDGSGKRAALPGVMVAAKTGTAEYGPKGGGLKMTWMIAFAPFENPRYAVAVLVEDGVSGGTTAAPRVKQLLANVFREIDGLEGMPLPSPVEVPTELPVEEPA